jgi:hypothetical protein
MEATLSLSIKTELEMETAFLPIIGNNVFIMQSISKSLLIIAGKFS